MTGIVQLARPEIDPATVLSGASISSGTSWYPAAFLANWIDGQAAELVPGCVIDKAVVAASTGVLHFRAMTRSVAIQRVWFVTMRGSVAGTTATVKAPASTGVAQPVILSSGRRPPIMYVEDLASQASAVTDLTFEITAAVGDIDIDSISCFELTRPILDAGVDTNSLRPRERIYSNGPVSASGIVGALLAVEPRRVVYQWAVPTITPVTRTGAFTNLLTLAQPILARKLNEGATVATVYWSAYAMVGAGSGDVLLTTTQSGVSDSVNVTATSFAWTAERAISVSCEDMNAADGLQSNAFDDLQAQLRGNGGQTLSLASLSVYDKEA